MQVKGQKKITVTSKNVNPKKPNLQIKVPPQSDSLDKQSNTNFTNFTKDGFSTPKHDPPIPLYGKTYPVAGAQTAESDKNGKKKGEGLGIQKRASGKEVQSPKVEVAPRLSANFGSPRATIGNNPQQTPKEKVLISYASQKNLNAIKPIEKKDTPTRGLKIDDVEKLLKEEKTKVQNLKTRQQELVFEIQGLKKEKQQLVEEVSELKKKIERHKISSQETKKMLKERIHCFNQQGGELQTLRKQIQTLQQRVTNLLAENQGLKADINKYECQLNISNIRDGQHISGLRQVVPLSGSRISSLYLHDCDDGDYKVFGDIDNIEEDLDLQSYITDKQESYLEDSKANLDVFDSIRQEYDRILANIEEKYKILAEKFEQTITTQAGQIYDLQMKNQELLQQQEGNFCETSSKLNIQLDEMILKAQDQIARLNLTIFELRSSNRELVEEAEHHKSQCQVLTAELQLSALRRKFKDENDKFEFGVAKLNLLNIIDKLKLQIDREKDKYRRLRERVTSKK